ncbi:2-dehydropantoate 2-reductase [Alkalibacillus silvisoli]|uniref:2-dehydropantoate 2-reductase n=1 Tax=Alkalibacillus silvisoli TaxID=392823 RepID=A0ABN0ZWE1_9BACI
MNVGVVGMGAVGMFVAYQLSYYGHNVTCYVRRDQQLDQLKQFGITVDNCSSVRPNVRHFNDLVAHEVLIVCTKQTQLDFVLSKLGESEQIHKSLLFLQNGMGHIQKLNELQHNQVFVGVCEHGVKKVSDQEIQLNGLGQIKVTSLKECEQVEHLKDLSHDQFPVHIDKDLFTVLNEKLVVNSVINPLTALFEVENGAILQYNHLANLAYSLTVEASQALQLDEVKMWELVKRVCAKTQHNTSSMLSDFQSKRPTEIQYMNGYLIEQSHLPLPNHHVIYELIKAKEEVSEVRKWTF